MKELIFIGLITSLFVGSSNLAVASGSHGADEHQQHEEAKGPHGGKLVEQNGLAIEVTIFEQGIPPEMRLYAYYNGKPLEPKQLDAKVVLKRLGGAQDNISFVAEADYLVGNKEVVEPHSFDVVISANYQGKGYNWEYQNHEGRAEISERLIQLSSIKTESVTAKELTFSDTLFGVVAIANDRKFQLHAAYPGLVKSIYVKVGEKVTRGQRLAILTNSETLQDYYLNSPSEGEITEVFVNRGERIDETAIVELNDLSTVWIDLSAFPENIERLAIGQEVNVYDLHHHLEVKSKISYIAPKMTGGHIARARAVISNEDGHWRPGMHIKADVDIEKRRVDMAVKATAIQSFRNMPVVFAKFGNVFEVRMVELGARDGEYIEVISGIAPGTEYVTENSFLLKAEVLKDGASHDH